ncbi:MAG: DNA integrity scanning protein DisA nucleotide-binding domain protein, partial [Clostridia bacterium]|nr:DNA integrity scanning protein DisA nucleotide-binding domain protein [Clostridia bacterium]
NFQVIYAVEMLCFFALIFYVSKVLRENDATKLMLLYWVLIVGGGCLHVFAETLVDREFFLFFVILVSAFMLILFNVEVKKSLWDVHSVKETVEKHGVGTTELRPQADTERCINNVIKALQNMSKNNVGALIVLSKGSLPKQVLQSGVEIDAEISTQLIEGIFFPKAPLHDGAMIIHGHKIQAAGCFLPLTQKTSYPKEYGTRHRAGIGITEVANVISLVVSEETGIISVIKQGNVTRYADYDMLLDALKDYYWQEMPLTDKKRGGNLR